MNETERIQATVYRLACFDFPWDVTRSLELALFRTFASPRIGGLLHATGEFEARPQKRYDDTDLIVSEIVEHGFASERGRRAIARMNAIHACFAIRNEDFLYVLSTFAFVPVRWIARFGWRPLTEAEAMDWFLFWREVGRGMGLAELPESRAAFETFSRRYEARYFRPTPANQKVALATRELFASWFPRVIRPLVRANIHTLLDYPLRTAFDFPEPGRLAQALAPGLLRLRAQALRILPKRRRPRLRTQMSHRSYPNGYVLDNLGENGTEGRLSDRP
ncbi:MAG: oxygenase MpaB family protein [Pseudomonadota bacterium]